MSKRDGHLTKRGSAQRRVKTRGYQKRDDIGGHKWRIGLVSVILLGIRFDRKSVPWLVGLYITAAYWFTSSTSFANPAVAVARSLTNTFSGIRPADLPGFIVAEFVGALCAFLVVTWLLRPTPTVETAS